MFYILVITIVTGLVLAVVGAIVVGLSVLSIWLSNVLTAKSTIGVLIAVLINGALLTGVIAYTISDFGDNYSYFSNFFLDVPLFFLVPIIYGSIVSLFAYLSVKFWNHRKLNTSGIAISIAFILLGCIFLTLGLICFLFFFAQAGGHAVF
jgi:hypothetical protein